MTRLRPTANMVLPEGHTREVGFQDGASNLFQDTLNTCVLGIIQPELKLTLAT